MKLHSELLTETLKGIEAAFANVSREDGVTLHESREIDDGGSDEERAAARALDTEMHWQDVPDEDIANQKSVLCFLDPKGLRYYLPAYMIWTLKNYATADSDTPENVFFWLTLPAQSHKSLRTHQRQYLVLFTLEQSQAIYKFLQFFVEIDSSCKKEAYRALESYWNIFCRE